MPIDVDLKVFPDEMSIAQNNPPPPHRESAQVSKVTASVFASSRISVELGNTYN